LTTDHDISDMLKLKILPTTHYSHAKNDNFDHDTFKT
jgi:hypothetical protein